MVLHLILYAAVALFVIAVLVRAAKIMSLPLHLRWELYPVAHERNASYGGSFFEHTDWWKRPREASVLGELKVMVPEIALLKGVHEHNRPLWFRSFPFHFGLYLIAGFAALLLVGAIAQANGAAVAADAEGLAGLLHWATLGIGLAGFGLLALGSLLLLLRRLGDPVLRNYSAPADFLNLILFLAGGVLGLVAWWTADRDFLVLRGFLQQAVTFEYEGSVPAPVAAEIVLGAVILAYIPLTHMSHFFTKYFMWHDIRWGDKVNVPGSATDAKVGRQLGQKVSWAAQHIQGGGTKTWVDVATEEVSKK
jgi:nitrate reductase gamma subunit